jgi:predicted nucleic acid-binding protein
MTFAQIPTGASVFLDANTLVYHFTKDGQYGPACAQLIQRVEQQDVRGFASTHGLADIAHRLMTVEAIQLFGWPIAGITARLRKHRGEIPKLTVYSQSLASLPRLQIQVVPVTQTLVEAATSLSRKHELLTGDALVVAVMQQQGLTNIASMDADFDRVPGVMRYAPV